MQALAYITHQAPWLWWALGGVLGSVLGSFIGCACYRLPRGLSLRQPTHSYCPACNHQLQVPDLIPLFSWLVLRGRCRHCGAPIGWAALGFEIIATVSGVAIAYFLTTRLG